MTKIPTYFDALLLLLLCIGAAAGSGSSVVLRADLEPFTAGDFGHVNDFNTGLIAVFGDTQDGGPLVAQSLMNVWEFQSQLMLKVCFFVISYD